jgi:transcriptional regulator with XRE-family HTH domain
MILQTLTSLIREQRRALGLTQGQLAELADLSRATIIDLEAGKVTDLGVSKLEKLLAVLDWSLTPTSHDKKPSDDPLKLAARSASTSYREMLPAQVLEESLTSGAIPQAYRAHLATLINEVPASLLTRAVKAAAQHQHVEPKIIWKNISRWSRELQTTRVF